MPEKPQSNRRDFLKTSSTAALSAGILSSLAIPRNAYADGDDTIRIGLVGCGGRGSKAAVQALSTSRARESQLKGKVKLVAMGDAFRDQLDSSLTRIERATKNVENAVVAVDEDHKFVGFDAIDKVLASDIDLIVLATPPGFRPQHFDKAVAAGKNVFMEKPVATDPAGIQMVLDAAAAAKAKNLKVGVGLQRHHQNNYLDIIKRVHDGAIGDVVATHVYWNSGGVWEPRRKREETKTEMEYQMRNWYYYNWICGDHIVEQHIHNLDVSNWIKGSMYPVKAVGMGGREVRKDKKYGNIFDHHAVEYTYEDGSKMFSQCRHQRSCWNSVSEYAIGTKGTVDLKANAIKNFDGSKYRYRGEGNDPYQTEHDDLFAAIRSNTEYSEAVNGAMSTMTAILGRLATYSGKEVEMQKALDSGISIQPNYSWDADMPNKPDADGVYQVPVPGIFKPYA